MLFLHVPLQSDGKFPIIQTEIIPESSYAGGSDMNTIFIGIAGGTGSGKTTLTEHLVSRFGDDIAVVHHDNYYKRQDCSFEERCKQNYDHPDAFDTDLMIRDLKKLKAGETIYCPVYDYAIHNRTDETVEIKPAKVVIVEVNENMPRCLGGFDNTIHISEVDMVVEGRNDPMGIQPSGEADDVDKAVARLIVEQIPDGACLQLGIGGMPNTVGAMLCQSDLKDLGVHTEMYVDAYVDLAMAGKVTCARKNIDRGRQVYAFAAGTQKLYDYLDDNPACMAAPISYTNDVRTIAAIDNFVSINNAVDVDLYGQVNGETAGTKQISGAGGQQDFVLGAYLSHGGKSFICLSSTHQNKDGTVASRIRPTLQTGSVVTDTRVNTMYVVTEYGCVCLKGLSVWERAEKLISIAHPDFRDELIREAEKQHIWYRHNKR